MVTINLRTGGGALEHIHENEDLSSQIDGYNSVFTTSFEYKPGSLIVRVDGLTFRSGEDDDFTETGAKEFTWNDSPVPGEGPGDCEATMFVSYLRKVP